jgi:hypothetical protein
MVCTGSAQCAVKGKSDSDSGGLKAARSMLAYATSGSATWNTPCVVRRSLIGLWSTPLSRR